MGLAGTGVVGLTGCTGSADGGTGTTRSAPTAAPDADEMARRQAVTRARGLLDGVTRLAGSQPALRSLLTRIAVDHREHLAALGAADTTGTALSLIHI